MRRRDEEHRIRKYTNNKPRKEHAAAETVGKIETSGLVMNSDELILLFREILVMNKVVFNKLSFLSLFGWLWRTLVWKKKARGQVFEHLRRCSRENNGFYSQTVGFIRKNAGLTKEKIN